MYHITYD